jgi:hypothetical protein
MGSPFLDSVKLKLEDMDLELNLWHTVSHFLSLPCIYINICDSVLRHCHIKSYGSLQKPRHINWDAGGVPESSSQVSYINKTSIRELAVHCLERHGLQCCSAPSDPPAGVCVFP